MAWDLFLHWLSTGTFVPLPTPLSRRRMRARKKHAEGRRGQPAWQYPLDNINATSHAAESNRPHSIWPESSEAQSLQNGHRYPLD